MVKTANSSGPVDLPHIPLLLSSLDHFGACKRKCSARKEVAGRTKMSRESWGGGGEDLSPNYSLVPELSVLRLGGGGNRDEGGRKLLPSRGYNGWG